MSKVLPILFNTDMVRAILDGRKSVTRRICKDANEYTIPDMSFYDAKKRTYAVHNYSDKEHTEKLSIIERTCPICPGDVLYVRETWERFDCCSCEGDEHGNCPKEPNKSVLDKSCGCYMYRATDEISGDAKWRPSIHMPKEAARIWLKVKDVRVERLQEMTEEQAEAEGIRGYSKDGNLYKYAVTDDWWIDYHNKHRKSFVGTWWQDMPRTAKDAFSYLWNSTIKKSDFDRYGWDANPWVWVIEFERCEKLEGWRV